MVRTNLVDLSGHVVRSIDLDDRAVEDADIVCVVTAHSGIDYARVVEDAQLVVDLRNATKRSGRVDGKVWKL